MLCKDNKSKFSLLSQIYLFNNVLVFLIQLPMSFFEIKNAADGKALPFKAEMLVIILGLQIREK